MTSRTDLLSLDDDVLWIIVSWLPHHAAAQLALTSRAVGTAARRRVLSSLQIAAPFASIEFHKFMLEEDDGYRLQCLRRLTINLSSLPPHELPDGYTPLADVLKRARNLQALVVPSLEQHLATRNGHVLGDAIAALHDLRELDLRSVGGKGLDLCKRLASKPDVLRFQALSTDTEPHTLIDRTMLSELNVLQRASTIILHEFTFVQSDHDRYQPLSPSPLPKSASLWPNAKTLRLKNMDPMPVVALCPNLASLYISAVNDGGPFYPDDVHNPYSTIDTLVPEVTTRLRVFDVSVNNDRSDLSETIDTIFRASYPRVLSIPYFWESLASVAKHPGSRLRYLDVLFHDHTDLAQDWLDEYLPMFSNCGILCIRIRLVEFIDDTITEQEWQSREDDDWDDWMVGSEWKELRDAIPNLVLKAVPSLRYVSVSPGYMVQDWNGLDEPAFVGQTRWWRATSGNSEAGLEDGQATAELVEIDAGEGQRIDEYMRSEAFQEGSLFPRQPSETIVVAGTPWDAIKLNDGTEIASIALGTWKLGNGQTTIDRVNQALEVGFTNTEIATVVNRIRGGLVMHQTYASAPYGVGAGFSYAMVYIPLDTWFADFRCWKNAAVRRDLGVGERERAPCGYGIVRAGVLAVSSATCFHGQSLLRPGRICAASRRRASTAYRHIASAYFKPICDRSPHTKA